MTDRQNSHLPVSSGGFWVELTLSQKLVQEQEDLLHRKFLAALKSWDRREAKFVFDALQEWNKLDEFITLAKNSLSQPDGVTYVLDVVFLRNLVRHLTRTPNEAIAYVSGYDLGQCKALTHIWGLQLDQQSPVYALANPRATVDALIEMLENAVPLLAMAHSHPGSGTFATSPSSTDLAYFGRVKATRADVLGIIVTRGGNVRFVKQGVPFKVLVQGKGIQELEKHVYKVSL